MREGLDVDARPLASELSQFIADAEFPCVGAKSALKKDQIRVVSAKSLTSSWNDCDIHLALSDFAKDYREEPQVFQSLAVIFEGPGSLSEDEFEKALWERVQSIHDKDRFRGFAYDSKVSSDPDNPHFSLSFGGNAFFVVGLHPRASRRSRRFGRPTLIFNPHDQFETLREEGRYEKLRAAIIARDIEYSGSANPMLSRHGETSEARQYAGRPVPSDWKCPFHAS